MTHLADALAALIFVALMGLAALLITVPDDVLMGWLP